MARSDIDHLIPLHEVDSRILEIQAKADEIKRRLGSTAGLDAAKKKLDDADQRYHRIHAELKDSELTQKGMQQKAEEHEKHLYSGQVVNPREVEQIEHEIRNLRSNADKFDEKIIRLLEVAPQAEEELEKARAEFEKASHAHEDFRTKASVVGKQMQSEYRELMEKRKEIFESLPPNARTRYVAIQKGTKGTAMAKITKERQCSKCGVTVSERAYDLARQDKFVTCDQCKRLLYVQVAEVSASE